MAKAMRITGIDTTANSYEGAVNVLRARFSEIIQFQTMALRSKDIEGVHDMRVATRRLRSILRDFRPILKQRPLVPINKELRNITDSLGSVRDKDVAIVTLEKLRSNAKNRQINEGIGKLLENRHAVREEERVRLEQFLTANYLDALQKQFELALKCARRKNKAASNFSYNEFGLTAITKRLNAFTALRKNIYKPFDAEALHQLRLAAKRLRYAIELFAIHRHPKFVKFALRLARMQNFLGEVHDCDVWITSLSGLLRDHDLNSAEYQIAAWLLSRFTEIRGKNYRSALSLWSNWKETGFLEKIEANISQTIS